MARQRGKRECELSDNDNDGKPKGSKRPRSQKKDFTRDNEEPTHPKHPQDPGKTNLSGVQQGRKHKRKSSDKDNDDKTKRSKRPRSQSKDTSQDNDSDEPSPPEHTRDPGEARLSGVQQVIITARIDDFPQAIRATDLAFGLRQIPAGFHVVVKADGTECQTSNKPVHVDQAVVEWNERILFIEKDSRPCEPSSKVRVSVYASFELGPMLCHGDVLRTFEISVGELLDRSEKSHLFQPKQEEVISPCTSLFVTVEQRLSDENDAAVLCPLTTLISSEMDALVLRTDAGHRLLARYRRTQNNRDLSQSINHFERASDLCHMGNPYRPAALFNLATAKSDRDPLDEITRDDSEEDLEDSESGINQGVDLAPEVSGSTSSTAQNQATGDEDEDDIESEMDEYGYGGLDEEEEVTDEEGDGEQADGLEEANDEVGPEDGEDDAMDEYEGHFLAAAISTSFLYLAFYSDSLLVRAVTLVTFDWGLLNMETANKLDDRDDIENAVSGADIDRVVWTEEEFSNLILNEMEPGKPCNEESHPKKKLKRSPKSVASQFQTRLEKEMVKNVQQARENAAYGSVVPLQIGTGADKKKRDKEDAYHIVEGQLVGNTKLVTVWHAVGHSFSAGATLVHCLKLLNVQLNSALRVLDPPQYEAMLKFQVALQTKYAHVKAMDAIDGLLWEGCSLQYNRWTPLHPESTDPPQAWVALVAFVNFTSELLSETVELKRLITGHDVHSSRSDQTCHAKRELMSFDSPTLLPATESESSLWYFGAFHPHWFQMNHQPDCTPELLEVDDEDGREEFDLYLLSCVEGDAGVGDRGDLH
ncbi:hypothetical protein EDB19DRAFT_1833592 [Suillus lakei]|nr:hypothetical protein EDB19DRAFT_1833592 [Suillus lakei]